MRTSALLFLLVVSAAVAGSLTVQPAPKKQYAGYVEEIHGKAFWKETARAGRKPLDPRWDLNKKLYVNQQVGCDAGGSLLLRLYGVRHAVTGAASPYTIPRETELLKTLSPEERRLARAKREASDQYDIGGPERAGATLLFVPAANGAVRPDSVVFRWTPRPGVSYVSLALSEPGGKEIWRQSGVSGAAGQLVSDAARQALLQYRAGRGQQDLLLTLTDLEGNASTVRFSLLSAEEEQELQRELAMGYEEPPNSLLRYLGRVRAFRRHRMFDKVAEEYDAALKSAPESRDLLIAAIQAHRAIGNVARVSKLMQRLPPGTKVPNQ